MTGYLWFTRVKRFLFNVSLPAKYKMELLSGKKWLICLFEEGMSALVYPAKVR